MCDTITNECWTCKLSVLTRLLKKSDVDISIYIGIKFV